MINYIVNIFFTSIISSFNLYFYGYYTAMKINNSPSLLSLTKFSYISGYTEEAVYQKRSKTHWKAEKITEDTLNGIQVNIFEYNKWCCLNEKNIDFKSLSAEKFSLLKKQFFLTISKLKNHFYVKWLDSLILISIGY